MPIALAHDSATLVATLSGELVKDDWLALSDAIGASPAGATSIDLSAVEYIDSAGLGELVQLVSRTRIRGGTVLLVSPSAFIRGVLEVTRLNTWFDILDS